MPDDAHQAASSPGVEVVRGAFAAALQGDLEAVRGLLAEDVKWHAAGDPGGGCQNREQATAWMREAIARGVEVDVLDVRALGEDRVLVLLARKSRRDDAAEAEPPQPHGQIVTFREGKVAEIVVYAGDREALEAAAGALMPLYDFRCHACGARFEARAASDELPVCPDCGSTDTERLLSPFAGPFTVAPRGAAARRSNDDRRVREEQRLERREERRRQRAERGESPSREPRRPGPSG